MNRRHFATALASGVFATLAGCTDGGIYAGSGGTPSAERAPLPSLLAPDHVPDGAATTLRIAWRAAAATRFDIDPNDGRVTTAPDGSKYVLLGYSISNVGEATIEFDPSWFSLTADGDAFSPKALTHLTPFYGLPINPGDTRGGWVAFQIPADLPAATLAVTQWAAERPFAVRFVADSSVSLPF